jgi:hypothetical protein
MVCEYDYFMPKGILSQLIVDLQPYIENHDLVWKTGVILRRENTYAEIKEDIQARKIFIRLAGHLKQQFTGIITDELDKINSMYHGLKTEKLIPCNCKLCSTSLSPQFFKLKEDLQQCLQHRVNDIRCNKSFENINILQLLGKVYDLGKPVSNLNDLVSLLEQIPKGSLNEKTAINLINIIGVNNIFKQDLLNGSMDFSASLDSLLYNEKLEEISSKLDDGFSEQSQRHDKQDKILEELNTKINACYLKFEKEIGNTERWNEIASLIIELNDNYEKASCEIVNQIFDWIDSNSEELKVYQLNLYNELKKTDNWKAKLKFGLPLAAVHGLDISVEGKVELNSLLKKISWKKDKH